MATTRFSINPGAPMHTIVQAVGAATVTCPIEVTIDFAALQSSMSSPLARGEAKRGLNKFSLPG